MKYQWTMKAKGRYVDSGSVEATSESEALNLVMIDQAEQDRDADTCYSLTCGSTATTSFGDEFLRSAGASSIDDAQLEPSGHTFAPSLADVGIDPHQDTADQLVKDIAEAIVKKVVTDAVTDMGFDLEPSCDKTMEDCRDKFDNVKNFTGTSRGAKCAHTLHDPGCGQPTDTYNLHPGGVITPADGLSLGDVITVDGDTYTITSIDRDANQATSAHGMKSGRMSANQPNLSQAPSRSPDTIIGRAMTGGAKGDTIDVIFDDGRMGSGQLGEKCVVNEGLRHGYDGRFYPPKYATGGIVQGGIPFDDGRNRPSWTPQGETVYGQGPPMVSNDLEYHPAPGNILGGALGEVKRAWINDQQVYPDPATTSPSSIICGSPHCQEVIPVGHLPMGTTSGVPCPGCDATYSVMRN